MKGLLYVTMLVSVAFALCAGTLATSSAQEFDAGIATIRLLKNPERIPELTLQTVDGKTVASSEWQGKVVLLDFWATWCSPCLDEIPDLIRLQSRYAGHLQIVALSLDWGPPDSVNSLLKRFVQQREINYTVAIASSELQGKLGGILGLPTAFLLDEHGRLVQKHVGVVNPGLYETEIRALLGLPVNAKIERFDDFGQVVPTKAKAARQLPGVDLSKLAPVRKEAALRLLNERMCPCGCVMKLAQCRIIDPACPTSLKLAAEVVAKISAETEGQ